MGINSEIIRGHDILAVERFRDDTRHMIIFDILTPFTSYGPVDQRMRLFLSDSGYAKAQNHQRNGEIKILRHAEVIEGHILSFRKEKHKQHKRRK